MVFDSYEPSTRLICCSSTSNSAYPVDSYSISCSWNYVNQSEKRKRIEEKLSLLTAQVQLIVLQLSDKCHCQRLSCVPLRHSQSVVSFSWYWNYIFGRIGHYFSLKLSTLYQQTSSIASYWYKTKTSQARGSLVSPLC